MRTFWGLMFAYWLSDRWKEAWTLTAVIIAFTVVSSKTGVWIAEASAELITGIALYHDPRTLDPMNTLIGSAVTLVALVVMKDVGIIGIRHLFSTTLHRKWRSFLNSRFNAALLDDNHTHFHLQNGMATTGPVGAGGLDNVDQRVQESIKGMTGGAIGLAMGIVGVTMSLLFVGMKLIETSNSVEGLEFLGAYATAVLALTAVAIYVPINTLVALRVGRVLEYLNATMQQTEGSYRGELTMFLRRSFQIAASGGERAQQALHDRLYLGIDRTWARLNRYSAGYMSFELIYNFFAARIVAYAPGFLSYTSGQIGLKNYVTGAELVNQLINECSWFIHVMPAIASLKANSRRVIELAVAIEDVQTPPDFYAKSGRSEFRYGTQDAKFGLTVRSLELTHQGHDVEPFMRAANMRFKPGSWTMIGGKYGGGKTSFLKALNGLWPYGRGMIVFPENVATLFAAQEIKLPRISLKQLVCLPHVDDGHSDVEVAAALHKAGLGQLIENLADEAREGVPWDQLLSGGQKQMLMLARILLHRPGLLFLDEATSALDPASRVAFHQALKDNCPDITVISIMHDAERPRAANGAEFYDHVVTIEDGMAVQRPIEVESIVSAQGAEPAAMRVPNVRLAEMVRAKPDR